MPKPSEPPKPRDVTGNSVYDQVKEEYGCIHESKEIRRLIASNGVVHFREQCLRCGDSLRAVRTLDVPLNVQLHAPPFDESLRKSWSEKRWARYGEIADERREAESEDWRRRYRAHMNSVAWATIRGRVLERAGGLCEGCRRREPVHVHHLTYERLGREMLFDLVALCVPCHESIHDREMED